jgi:adenylylsulfate kinase
MSKNLFPNKGLVKREASPVIWLTGLSGSGKSTIANELELTLENKGIKSYVLDGDNIRTGLNSDLGFSDNDRKENMRRIAEVAKLFADSGTIAIAAFISPFREERAEAKRVIGAENFIEVHVDASLEICEKRDVKGLYKKARAGEIPNFTGIDSPYEEPEHPDVVAESGRATIHTCVDKIMFVLERKGYIKEID